MEISKAFLELEKEVMIKLLDGTDDTLKVFREQYYRALVKKREFSVMGFFTLFEMPEDSPLSEPPMSIQLGDVVGQLDGVKNGIGFVLFIKNGFIQMLEGYTYGDEKWPKNFTEFKVSYISGSNRDVKKIWEKLK